MAGLTPEDSIFGNKASSNSKSPPERDAGSSPLCPHCKSTKVWKDGIRRSFFGDKIQRWVCQKCGRRFSDPQDVARAQKPFERIETVERQSLKSIDDIVTNCQICVTETKNLAAEQQKPEVLQRNENSDIKGKIIEYAWWLKKDGKSESTIIGRTKILRILTKRGANLYDPESIKEAIAKQPWSNGRKNNAVDAYSSFLKMADGKWNPPLYQTIRKLPFIPKETEIDQLIAGVQPTHGNIPTDTQGDRRKMRRNLVAQMGRHRLRKQSNQHNTRKEQQPKSRTPKPQTPKNARKPPQNYGDRDSQTPT